MMEFSIVISVTLFIGAVMFQLTYRLLDVFDPDLNESGRYQKTALGFLSILCYVVGTVWFLVAWAWS